MTRRLHIERITRGKRDRIDTDYYIGDKSKRGENIPHFGSRGMAIGYNSLGEINQQMEIIQAFMDREIITSGELRIR